MLNACQPHRCTAPPMLPSSGPCILSMWFCSYRLLWLDLKPPGCHAILGVQPDLRGLLARLANPAKEDWGCCPIISEKVWTDNTHPVTFSLSEK
eukprot:615380-Ditylum_brightwellii.AAC.1